MTLRDEAEVLRLGLETGVIDAQAVAAWAEKVIASLDLPPVEIIDLSMAHNIPDLISKLGEIKGNVDYRVIWAPYLKLVYSALNKDKDIAPVVAKKLFGVVVGGTYSFPKDIEIEMYCFEHDFDHAKEHEYFDIDSLNTEFIEHVKAWSNYSVSDIK